MGRNIFLLVSASILMMAFSAFTVFTGSMGNVDHEVELVKRSGGTRSGEATEVRAFIYDNQTLTVEVENYNGMVWVDVTGTGGVRGQAAQVNGAGFILMDLSTLPQGRYLLTVTLENGLYEGYFEH